MFRVWHKCIAGSVHWTCHHLQNSTEVGVAENAATGLIVPTLTESENVAVHPPLVVMVRVTLYPPAP